MKILRLIVVSFLCMSFLIHCFFTVLLMMIVDNIRIEEFVYYSWVSESQIKQDKKERLNERLREIVVEIESSLMMDSCSDVAVSYKIDGDVSKAFTISFYVRYDVALGTRIFSGTSKEYNDLVINIVNDHLSREDGILIE